MAKKPDRAAALEATEGRLAVRFPDDYREFVLERPSYDVMAKHIDLYPVDRCDWTEREDAVVIGESFTGGRAALVFKRQRSALSDVVYELVGTRFKRRPRFAELVARKLGSAALSDAPALRLAERLTGFARRCTCGREVRVGELCSCMRLASRSDPEYTLTADEVTTARAELPEVVLAAELARDLKAQGHAVPSGPRQLVAAAQLLRTASASEAARGLLEAWRATGMTIDLDEARIAAAIERRAKT